MGTVDAVTIRLEASIQNCASGDGNAARAAQTNRRGLGSLAQSSTLAAPSQLCQIRPLKLRPVTDHRAVQNDALKFLTDDPESEV
jgi:hypothetical protein